MIDPDQTPAPRGAEPGLAQQPGGEQRIERALLASIRHDLRTPINAILGYSEMLLEDEAALTAAGESVKSDLQRIQGAGAELLGLVNEVLDPARIEAAADLSLEHVGAQLRRDLRTPISAIVGYCEMLIEDVVAGGGEDIVPDLRKIHAASHRFLALIEDVVNFSTAGREAGAALSSMKLERDGAGAAALVQDAITSIRALDRDAHAASGARGAVLIVDDNEINRDVLSRHLERQGHAVTAVENGRAALRAVAESPCDLVLLDILMPEINGYEVLHQLKADEATRDIPVIMISALDELDTVVRCIEMGAEDYLTKPFNPTLLRARTTACLEKKRLRDKEKEYLHHVAKLTTAAAAVEANAFDPGSLAEAAGRADELGHLARVFQRMASEVHTRESRLRAEVDQLRIEIDQVKMTRQVEQITETDYFQQLQLRAQKLRAGRTVDR